MHAAKMVVGTERGAVGQLVAAAHGPEQTWWSCKSLNLNVHFHSLVLDGVYAAGPSGALRFHPLPPRTTPRSGA